MTVPAIKNLITARGSDAAPSSIMCTSAKQMSVTSQAGRTLKEPSVPSICCDARALTKGSQKHIPVLHYSFPDSHIIRI
jgi:hypothetical protein